MSYTRPTPQLKAELHLPRILCLHGGGSSAQIFKLQCRKLRKELASSFRLVFADAPWFSEAGPDVMPVYKDFGPFRRWLRWKPHHPSLGNAQAARTLLTVIEQACAEDLGTGPWIGILGFSQGAKIAASLLYNQQLQRSRWGFASTNFRFGVLVAGRGPLVCLADDITDEALDAADDLSNERPECAGMPYEILHIPTIHVHGLKDPGLHFHRRFLHQCHDPLQTVLIEWPGTHRMPVQSGDVQPLVEEIRRFANLNGAFSA